MSAIERHGVLEFAKMMAELGDPRLIHLEDAADLQALAQAYVDLDAKAAVVAVREGDE